MNIEELALKLAGLSDEEVRVIQSDLFVGVTYEEVVERMRTDPKYLSVVRLAYSAFNKTGQFLVNQGAEMQAIPFALCIAKLEEMANYAGVSVE